MFCVKMAVLSRFYSFYQEISAILAENSYTFKEQNLLTYSIKEIKRLIPWISFTPGVSSNA